MKKITTFIIVLLAFTNFVLAQNIPFLIENNSTYSDDELYIAIVGQDLSEQRTHVWVDLKTGIQHPMLTSYNIVDGPQYGGNKGPGGNGKYAACFSKLSEIPQKEVNLLQIQGCRMFIATKNPLYLYFFGAQGGYTSPSYSNPTDPNQGITYEIIELTSNQYGFWGNTSRVDGYHYPIALELYGANNFIKKTGELINHDMVISEFLKSVPTEFQNCYNPTTHQILQPTKTKDFADGTIGTMPNPGPYKDYMKPYIDAIWEKYKNEDLLFKAGDAGTWKGRVENEQLVMTCIEGGFLGKKGIIERRPTTQEAFEGKGVLDNIVQYATTDLMIQAQICAAITRHVIDVKTPNVGMQTFSDPTKYYLESPCNHYAKFWHQKGIRHDEKAYGFAYDDVFEQSATLHTPNPTKVKVIFGGFYKPIVSANFENQTTSNLVYPNPATNTLFIQTQTNNNNISIYNLQGVLIINYENKKNIDISSFEKGMYLIQIESEKEVSKAFFIKN